MNNFIDIHTHFVDTQQSDVFALRNILFPKESIPIGTPCSVGIHPWYLPPIQSEAIALLEQVISQQNVLAIGECGLDKNSDRPFELQILYFRAQIALANRLYKPLIIHCVKSYQECIQILEESNNRVPVIFHGFSKHQTLAEQLLKKGFFLSLGAHILKGRHDDMLQKLPLDQIFFETDDQRLEIGEIYHYFCRVRKIAIADLSAQICKNFDRIFTGRI